MAVEQLGVDAAIIFADILLPLDAMGRELEYVKGEGPVIHKPVRTVADVETLGDCSARESLSYVFDALKLTRRSLKDDVALIGFAGAPLRWLRISLKVEARAVSRRRKPSCTAIKRHGMPFSIS